MSMRSIVFVGAALVVLTPEPSAAQAIFRSVQSVNLPTAETLSQGSWLFEISHRFGTRVSDGADALWGFDGPVRNRLGLSYAVSDRATLGVLRSNFEDNLELNAKLRVLEGGSEGVVAKAAVMAGVAWNTQPSLVEGAEDNESQLYGQVILNVRLGNSLAVGVVPTYLRNPRIRDVDQADAFVVGLYGQFFATRSTSFLAEWIVSEERPDLTDDSASFGVEFATRGHFFKLILTNQIRMNPTQFLGGTPFAFEPDEWRVGFNITRILPF